MNIIKVDTIDSTNSFLKRAVRSKMINAPTCVWTQNQTKGVGQRGSSWSSEPNKNISLSLFFPVTTHFYSTPFALNMLVALSVKKALDYLHLPMLKIKWPNDILSDNKKIGGILIENSYQNDVPYETIIGIGLNVNQQNFKNLPKASSLKNILGVEVNNKRLLHKVLEQLEFDFYKYKKENFFNLKKDFESALFRNKKASIFKISNKEFMGVIQGVSKEGFLEVLEENNQLNKYELKQIELKY